MKSVSQWAASFNYCLISLFIIAYFSCSIIWLWLTGPEWLKPSGPCATTLRTWLTPFTSLTGLEQSWAFFSPNVNSENSYTLIVISFQNGLLKLVESPRLEKLNLLGKFAQEKYRKLFNDNMPKSSFAFMRPDIARFASRVNNETGNEPMRVAFYLISKPIPKPDLRRTLNSIQNNDQGTRIEKYFVYGVNRDDL